MNLPGVPSHLVSGVGQGFWRDRVVTIGRRVIRGRQRSPSESRALAWLMSLAAQGLPAAPGLSYQEAAEGRQGMTGLRAASQTLQEFLLNGIGPPPSPGAKFRAWEECRASSPE